MTFRENAEATAQGVVELLGTEPPLEVMAKIADVIEKTMIDVALEARNSCADVALNQSGAEKDLAHQIADKIRRESSVLITNLSSLR